MLIFLCRLPSMKCWWNKASNPEKFMIMPGYSLENQLSANPFSVVGEK